jgi:hypothetical protein
MLSPAMWLVIHIFDVATSIRSVQVFRGQGSQYLFVEFIKWALWTHPETQIELKTYWSIQSVIAQRCRMLVFLTSLCIFCASENSTSSPIGIVQPPVRDSCKWVETNINLLIRYKCVWAFATIAELQPLRWGCTARFPSVGLKIGPTGHTGRLCSELQTCREVKGN